MKFLKNQFIQCNDVNLAYYEYGDGEVLIFLHGNSCGKEVFINYQLKHFKKYKTYAIDSRGHGKSKSEDINFSIEQFSNDIINFCLLKGIKKAFLVGHSDGGNIGLVLAHRRPDIFKKIIVISPNYLVSGTKEWFLKLLYMLIGFLKLLKNLGIKTEKIINITMLMLTDCGITEDQLMNIRSSVKIIYAERELIKHEHFEELNSLIPNCEMQMVKKSNHLSVLYKKETINLIKYFLTS